MASGAMKWVSGGWNSGLHRWKSDGDGWSRAPEARRKDADAEAGASAGLGAWLVAWLAGRMRNRQKIAPRLALVERISLAPRQSLALVEAEGRRILVATSPEGGPAFYPLDERVGVAAVRKTPRAMGGRARASW